jgi:hypothetical protein
MDKQLTDTPLEPGTRDLGAGRGATVGIGPDTASETPEIEIETGTDETATVTVTEETVIETAAGIETETETEIVIATDGTDEIAAYRPAERDIAAEAAAGVGVDKKALKNMD